MGILWKPTGSLDVNTAPTDLPEQSDGGGIISGALARCKNLRLDRSGMAQTRYGSRLIVGLSVSSAPDSVVEVGGHRYIFAGNQIFYDEAETTDGTQTPDPSFSPVGGSYLADQTVTISCDLGDAVIYYTTNGDDPDTDSTKYVGPFVMPGNNSLKAYATDPRGYLTDSQVVTDYYATYAQNTLITETDLDTLITETDSDTLTTEGP